MRISIYDGSIPGPIIVGGVNLEEVRHTIRSFTTHFVPMIQSIIPGIRIAIDEEIIFDSSIGKNIAKEWFEKRKKEI